MSTSKPASQSPSPQSPVPESPVPESPVPESPLTAQPPEVSLGDFQKLIREMYHEKDVARGIDGTFMWLIEEVGELAAALRGDDVANRREEFADVLAWLATIANVANVDLAQAVADKYGSGCPGCGKLVCECAGSIKP